MSDALSISLALLIGFVGWSFAGVSGIRLAERRAYRAGQIASLALILIAICVARWT